MTAAMAKTYRIKEEHPRCLECGDEIVYGRSDKKFCGVSCRARYHNREAGSSKSRMRILSILDRNYSILEGLLSLEITSIGNAELGALGFNHEVITSSAKIRGHTEVSCFDIRYFRSETKIFNIHRAVSAPLDGWQPDGSMNKRH